MFARHFTNFVQIRLELKDIMSGLIFSLLFSIKRNVEIRDT